MSISEVICGIDCPHPGRRDLFSHTYMHGLGSFWCPPSIAVYLSIYLSGCRSEKFLLAVFGYSSGWVVRFLSESGLRGLSTIAGWLCVTII